MPRLVRHDAEGPYKIEPRDKPVFICACGLSQNLPYCDASHNACKTEPDGKLVVYDRSRRRVIEERDDDIA